MGKGTANGRVLTSMAVPTTAAQATTPMETLQDVVAYRGKNFDPRIEGVLYDWWDRSNFFSPGPQKEGEKPFVMMLPLPNVTGDLHLGHALGFGGYQDIMARQARMQGRQTLWLPGTDHAGIIAQIVVEKELAASAAASQPGDGQAGATQTGAKPTFSSARSLGLTRDEFLVEMDRWMEHYKPRIYKQLRSLGCSLDWSRVHFTMDADMQQRVRTHFIRLFNKGHLYRADRIVHWCVKCQTTYSDLESSHTERTDTITYVRYPWAATMPAGTPDMVIATTRPETIAADTAIAVRPSDARWNAYIGQEVVVPLTEVTEGPHSTAGQSASMLGKPGLMHGRLIKIVADDAVDPTFGTGALKVTPGHDAKDFDIGQRHGLETITVIGQDGKLLANAGALAGLDARSGRLLAVNELKTLGLLVKEEAITHQVGTHDRCGTTDEPLVMKQWWVRMVPLAQPAIDAVRTGKVKIIPAYQEKIFFEWMDNIKDWPVSRQIWWGHAIPVWYCADCSGTTVPLEGPVGGALAGATDPVKCGTCASTNITQDPDVLDTWFSSALWPHTTLGWPDATEDLARFYPGTVLETGWDILFFWVARMLMMGIENMGDVPFKTIYLHGLVRVPSDASAAGDAGYASEDGGATAAGDASGVGGASGASADGVASEGSGSSAEGGVLKKPLKKILKKMGKSAGNAVSPMGIIEKHGADALRYALVAGIAAGADSQFSQDKLKGGTFFVNKLWNIGRFAISQIEANPNALTSPIDVPPTGTDLTEADRWIISRTDANISRLTQLLEDFQFGEYATALHSFVWDELADFYIELAKPMRRPAGSEGAAVRTLAYVLDRTLRLAHPIMPFVTETLALQLWSYGQTTPSRSANQTSSTSQISQTGQTTAQATNPPAPSVAAPAASLVTAAWPVPGESDVALEGSFSLATDIIRAIRDRRVSAKLDPRTLLEVHLAGDVEALRPLTQTISSLSNSTVHFGTSPSSPTLVGAVEVSIDAPAQVKDTASDRARLEKELAHATTLLEKTRALLASDFVQKAPAQLVRDEQAKLAQREAAVAVLQAELKRAIGGN